MSTSSSSPEKKAVSPLHGASSCEAKPLTFDTTEIGSILAKKHTVTVAKAEETLVSKRPNLLASDEDVITTADETSKDAAHNLRGSLQNRDHNFSS